MCKRRTDDPLVRKFLDDYGVNLLRLPRERADCGDLYIKNGRNVSAPGDVRELLEPAVELPEPERGERLADLSGTLSKKLSFDVGLGILESFLAALGAAGIVDELKAGFRRSRATGLRFRFREATRDSVDPLGLGNALDGTRFRTSNPLVLPGSEFYVVGGVVRTPSISIALEDERSQTVDLGADVLKAVSANASVSAERSDGGEITYKGGTPLAIGVELYALRYDATLGRFQMKASDEALPLKARPTPPPRELVAEDDEALLEVVG